MSRLQTNSQFLISTIDQVKKDYSPIILIVGKQRRGKSNMGLAIADKLMHHFHNRSFEPKKNLFFDPLELIIRMEEATQEPLIIDEAGVGLNAQEFYSHLNIAMNKIIQTQAYRNNVYILILPMAVNLAKIHRRFINFRLNMVARGVARVHKYIVRYEDFGEKKMKNPFIFLEHFTHPFFQGQVWDEYTEMAKEKKDEVLRDVKDNLIAMRQKNLWICGACSTENIKGLLKCKNCGLTKGYGS